MVHLPLALVVFLCRAFVTRRVCMLELRGQMYPSKHYECSFPDDESSEKWTGTGERQNG